MNQNVVKNLCNTKTQKETKEAMAENRQRRGSAYCDACDRWWYGVSRKRCEVHNPKNRLISQTK